MSRRGAAVRGGALLLAVLLAGCAKSDEGAPSSAESAQMEPSARGAGSKASGDEGVMYGEDEPAASPGFLPPMAPPPPPGDYRVQPSDAAAAAAQAAQAMARPEAESGKRDESTVRGPSGATAPATYALDASGAGGQNRPTEVDEVTEEEGYLGDGEDRKKEVQKAVADKLILGGVLKPGSATRLLQGGEELANVDSAFEVSPDVEKTPLPLRQVVAQQREVDVDGWSDDEEPEEPSKERSKGKATKREDKDGRFRWHNQQAVDDSEDDGTRVTGEEKSGGKWRGESGRRSSRGREQRGLRDGKDASQVTAVEDGQDARPTSFLPRKLYFENTYLGGDAAFQERVRRLDDALVDVSLPHRQALGYMQPFDPPEDAGLALIADVDRRTVEHPGRVILQIGLQGSLRYGWRRPPLDVVLVLDGPAIAEDPEMAVKVAGELLGQLGPQDHLGVVVAGPRPQVLAPLGRIRSLRGQLALAFDALGPIPASGSGALAEAMEQAGAMLDAVSQDRTTLPGTQTVLVVARGVDGDRVQPARQVAHGLTLRGMVTSVIETGGGEGLWWSVNDAGYGNYHRVEGRDPREAVRAELESLSRVVARLVRINVRLAPNVHAIRILGSRVLDEQEVAQVKAREVATDQNISRTLGVKADRGDDDDGLQTVIPYFYGADSHVVLIELWVDRPGPIADVTLRYKDMVNLDNATARASVSVRNLPRDQTGEQVVVRDNARGFRIGEALEHASVSLGHGDVAAARGWIEQARQAATRAHSADRQLVADFASLLDAGDLTYDAGRRALVTQSLFVAARRKVGANKVLAR